VIRRALVETWDRGLRDWVQTQAREARASASESANRLASSVGKDLESSHGS
jgi:hypothetical protein